MFIEGWSSSKFLERASNTKAFGNQQPIRNFPWLHVAFITLYFLMPVFLTWRHGMLTPLVVRALR